MLALQQLWDVLAEGPVSAQDGNSWNLSLPPVKGLPDLQVLCDHHPQAGPGDSALVGRWETVSTLPLQHSLPLLGAQGISALGRRAPPRALRDPSSSVHSQELPLQPGV